MCGLGPASRVKSDMEAISSRLKLLAVFFQAELKLDIIIRSENLRDVPATRRPGHGRQMNLIYYSYYTG